MEDAMDIYELLHTDHEKVARLFEQLESAEEGERAELVRAIELELVPHAKSEEKLFYAALKEFAESKDIALEGDEEHAQIEHLLEELQAVDVADETFAAKAKVLKEAVEHHVEEEEGEMFTKAKRVLSAEQAFALAQEVTAEKLVQRKELLGGDEEPAAAIELEEQPPAH
jgi:hypothetical protein